MSTIVRRRSPLPFLRARAVLLAVLLSALSAVWVAAPAAALDPPAGNAFYVPPDPLPPGRPGDVIWHRVASTSIARDNNATAYEVLYRSTGVDGRANAVSGTVLVPNAAWGGGGTRPLTADATGTQGGDGSCAPSYSMRAGLFDEAFAVTNLLRRGWAVAVTDYPGLGTPGDHQYNVGISEGRAVMDVLRAATRLAPARIDPATTIGIEGYSQGGGAAGWVAQSAPSYAPELRIAGIAAGGIPANLQAVKENIDDSLFFAFLAGTAIGFRAAYPAIDVDRYLTPYGRSEIARLNGMCQIPALIAFANKEIRDYTIGGMDPTVQPDFRAALDANNLGGTRPSAPMLVYHGWLDEVIPWGQVAQRVHGQWCALGGNMKLKGYIAEHVSTQIISQNDTVNWLADRIAGRPQTSDC